MTRRDHAVLTALACAGLLLVLFQVYYISLPLEDASTIDFCRISPVVNCFKSLHAHGHELTAFAVPVFPALACIFLFQAALCGFAWVIGPGRREAWLAIARAVSFPASGFAIFVLLNDLTVAKATSASGILVAIASLSISVLAVVHGAGGARIRHAGRTVFWLALAALLAGFLLHGAASSRRLRDEVMREKLSAEPGVLWPRVLQAVPRAGAAALGRWMAPREVLLFLDPKDEASQAVMREAARIMPQYADRLLLSIYARGEQGARLVLAHRAGTLASYLQDPTAASAGDPMSVRDLVRRQEQGWPEGARLPLAVWKGGRREGGFKLREALEAALAE